MKSLYHIKFFSLLTNNQAYKERDKLREKFMWSKDKFKYYIAKRFYEENGKISAN